MSIKIKIKKSICILIFNSLSLVIVLYSYVKVVPERVKRENGERPLQPRYCEGLRKLLRFQSISHCAPDGAWEGVTSRHETLSQETCHFKTLLFYCDLRGRGLEYPSVGFSLR